MILACVCSLSGAARADETSSGKEARAAAAKGLALLQSSAETYVENRDCFTCHHQALPAMAVALAKSNGLPVDGDSARDQAEFTRRYFAGRLKRLPTGQGVPGGAYTAGYALVSLRAEGWPADEVTDALTDYLVKTAESDGHWRIRTRRPPLEDSHFTATALAVRGLRLYARDGRLDETEKLVEKAGKWLAETAATSNEDRTFRLLGLHWSGAKPEAIRQARQELEDNQRDDGGWAQSPKMESDAYATGQALFALRVAGAADVDSDGYQRGLRYLLKTQQPDGSWKVLTHSRPIQVYFESGFPHGKSQFISICGTSWAVMALTLSLPELKQPEF